MLSIENLTVTYGENCSPAVDGFCLDIDPGEIVCIVGESGSGKTSVIRAVLGLLPPAGRICSGRICFDERSLLSCDDEEWRSIRGEQISAVFQDAGAMLDPIRRVGRQYVEYIRAHRNISRPDAWDICLKKLQKMRLSDADAVLNAYPFQLSVGMRQRVGIAMAMTFEPRLLLADEPTSALDAAAQVRIVREMKELRETENTAIILVTHNLGVAADIADRILVMRDGIVVDQGSRERILLEPSDPYTRQLIESVPTMGGNRFV